MKLKLALMAASLSFFAASPASALIEARVTYGMLASQPNLSDLTPGATATMPSIVPNYGPGFDALIFPPLLGFGAGVRYETLGIKADGNGISADSKTTRTSILLTYRLIDTILHIGPILSYGVSHSNNFEVNDSNQNKKFAWEPDSTTSYSVGLDVGLGLGPFVLGGEGGYESLKWDKMKASNSTTTPDTNMSGSYLKLYFGFGI